MLAVVDRYDPTVVGKLAVDDLADELQPAELELHLVAEQRHEHRVVGVLQQSPQFEHRLARQDDLVAHVAVEQLARGQRQPMAVGGDEREFLLVHHQEHPVQVVADVLLGHRVLREADQLAQFALRQCDLGTRLGTFREAGKIRRRQRLHAEAASTRLQLDLGVLLVERDAGAIRQRSQDVEQLLRRDRDREILADALAFHRCRHLDLEIGREQRHHAAFRLDQNIRQDRQGLSSLHHTGDGLQGAQQCIAIELYVLHFSFNLVDSDRRTTNRWAIRSEPDRARSCDAKRSCRSSCMACGQFLDEMLEHGRTAGAYPQFVSRLSTQHLDQCVEVPA